MTLVDAFFLMVLVWVTTRITSRIFGHSVDSTREKIVSKIMIDLHKEQLIPLSIEVDGDQYLCYHSMTNFVQDSQTNRQHLSKVTML